MVTDTEIKHLRPRYFQASIMARYMSLKQIESFKDEYRQYSKRSRTARKPSDVDQKITAKFRATKSMSETAKAFGKEMTVQRVHGAVMRVVAWEK